MTRPEFQSFIDLPQSFHYQNDNVDLETLTSQQTIQQILAANGIIELPKSEPKTFTRPNAGISLKDPTKLSNIFNSSSFLSAEEKKVNGTYLEKIWVPQVNLDPYKTMIEKIDIDQYMKESNDVTTHRRKSSVYNESGKVVFSSLKAKPGFKHLGIQNEFINQIPSADTMNISSMMADPNVGLQKFNVTKNPSLNKNKSEIKENKPVARAPNIQTERSTQTISFKNNFINYTYSPTIYGNEPIPAMIFHTGISNGENIYYFGGLKKLCPITENLNESLKKIKVNGPNYPFPLKNEILNNPLYVNNSDLFILDGETNIVSKPKLSGDIPPPLCCSSATLISSRYVFYYGGFEIKNKLADKDEETFLIERSFEVSNKAWILDLISFNFKSIELAQNENANLKVTIKLERFGHSIVAEELKTTDLLENLTSQLNFFDGATNETIKSEPATSIASQKTNVKRKSVCSLVVFGGYIYNYNTNKFSCSNYNWQIDLNFEKGTNNFLKFDSLGLYSCLESLNEGPSPRGFHGAILLDEVIINNEKIYYAVNSSTGNIRKPIDPRNKEIIKSQVIIIHGGSNLNNLFGDIWKYTFFNKKWEKIESKSPKFETDEIKPIENEFINTELHLANHQIFMLDEYLIFIGGFGPGFVKSPKSKKNLVLDCEGIIDNLMKKSDVKYSKNIMMDLSSDLFVFTKCNNQTLNYINYKKLFGNFEIDDEFLIDIKNLLNNHYVPPNINDSGSVIFKRLIIDKYQYRWDKYITQSLIFLLKTKDFLNCASLNYLGNSVVFHDGKIIINGGVVLPKIGIIKEDEKKNQVFLNKLTSEQIELYKSWLYTGAPSSVAIHLELPLFSKSYMKSY